MSMDIFQFWSEVGESDKVHPKDRYVLDRVRYNFDLKCLPGCFMGPLRTAPVVLLYLSPGWHESDIVEATSPEGCDRHYQRRKGCQSLPGPDDHRATWEWWRARTRVFGEWEQLRTKIAILNICAYHSKEFEDHPLLVALPSSRVSLEWAQTMLFRQAIDGELTVVCMRAARYWGLRKEWQKGKVFVPAVTPGGHMHKKGTMGRTEVDANS